MWSLNTSHCKEPGLLKRWVTQGLGKEVYKISLKCLVITKNKGIVKYLIRIMSKALRIPVERAHL
jgi:hypothetical protein